MPPTRCHFVVYYVIIIYVITIDSITRRNNEIQGIDSFLVGSFDNTITGSLHDVRGDDNTSNYNSGDYNPSNDNPSDYNSGNNHHHSEG